VALCIWIGVLWAFAYFMGSPGKRLPEPPPIDAQVIEIPPPVPALHTPPEEKKPVSPPVKTVIPSRPRPTVAPSATIEKSPSPIREDKPTPEPDIQKNPDIEPSKPAEPALQKTPTPPVQEKSDTANPTMTGTSGAQAIVRPMPQIPEELRQDALSAFALARFHVSADGTVTVELAKPTQNPRLNRLLLETLKNWRFFPAMKDGKPVSSTEEIVIKIEVK
jgi:periplasmic protein TonB